MTVEMAGNFTRELDSLPQVLDLVESFFAQARLDQKDQYPIELAIEEVFTNFVEHNSGGSDGISIRIRRDGGVVSIVLTDYDAPRFDVTKDAPQVRINAPLDAREPGGLGLYLVRKMMDTIEYRHENGAGTVLLSKSVG
jgi:serine/threonine-protein kinase RsbW